MSTAAQKLDVGQLSALAARVESTVAGAPHRGGLLVVVVAAASSPAPL